MNKSFYFGNVKFTLDVSCEIEVHEKIKEFLDPVTDIMKTVIYHVKFTEELEPVELQYLTQIDYPPHIIGNTKNGECRIYRDVLRRQPLAMYREICIDEVELTFYKECPEIWQVTLDDINYMAIERQLIHAGTLILHSSFIAADGGAILFTAPSGTGKSTQAELWERYGGAIVMNGDRALLVKTSKGWRVAGCPFSGSSGISHNGLYQLRALVMIHQACENESTIVSDSVAFRRTYPEIVRNYWNREYENSVVELLGEFLSSTVKIVLGCNMEESAVRCLEKIIVAGEKKNEDN